jgi:hypothetical protein
MRETSAFVQEKTAQKEWNRSRIIENNQFIKIPKNPSSYPQSKVRIAEGVLGSCCGVITAIWAQ